MKQQDEIAAIELETTPRWVAEHMMRLCERIDKQEADLARAMEGTHERLLMLKGLLDRVEAIEAHLMRQAEENEAAKERVERE